MDPALHSYCHLASLPVCVGVTVWQLLGQGISHSEFSVSLDEWICSLGVEMMDCKMKIM